MARRRRGKIYNTICDAPQGAGFSIERMSEFVGRENEDKTLPHVHPFYEIVWFRTSGGTHTVDFIDYPVEANTMFFIAPGQVHHFDKDALQSGIVFKFCTDFMCEESAMENLFIKYNIFYPCTTCAYCTVRPDKVAELERLVAAMEDEMGRGDSFGHADVLRSLMTLFLVCVRRSSTHETAAALTIAHSSHRLFVRFRQELEAHYMEYHSVQEYAERLSVNSRTLSNTVMECTGRSASAFVNDRIILEAKRLLRYSSLMIKEIVFYLGYDDPSYFVKFFKRQTGYLPSDFRVNRTKD